MFSDGIGKQHRAVIGSEEKIDRCHQRCSIKKAVRKTYSIFRQYSQENTCVEVSF